MRKVSISFLLVLLSLFLNFYQAGAQDDIIFRKYVVRSGVNGFFYGVAFGYIAGIEEGPAAGVAIVSAGTAALIPVFNTSAREVTFNQILLSNHGKLTGWVHGFALSSLIAGEGAWEGNGTKYTIAAGAASSIGLGILGSSLAKKHIDWSEGRVGIYRHYGWVTPLTGLLTTIALSKEEPDLRVLGATTLFSGAAGYYIAHKVYNTYNYTRGDIRATQVLTGMNGLLGFGIMTDIIDNTDDVNQSVLLYPAIGVVSGTVLGHLWMKGTNFTPKQGLRTAYAAGGGGLLGLGIALIFNSEGPTSYYTLSYLAGLSTYAVAVETMRKKNKTFEFVPDKKLSNWDFSFMPQNLILNNKFAGKQVSLDGRSIGLQPLFAASVTF